MALSGYTAIERVSLVQRGSQIHASWTGRIAQPLQENLPEIWYLITTLYASRQGREKGTTGIQPDLQTARKLIDGVRLSIYRCQCFVGLTKNDWKRVYHGTLASCISTPCTCSSYLVNGRVHTNRNFHVLLHGCPPDSGIFSFQLQQQG